MRLADLIPPVAEAFLKDQITIGHALLIAKLPASQQQEAFSASFRGLWTSEGNSQVLIPVRELAPWIESNIFIQLASAPFDKQDETLVPAAGSCVNCRKRTGFNKLLFPDVRKDSCTSPDCFRAKIDACVKKTAWAKVIFLRGTLTRPFDYGNLIFVQLPIGDGYTRLDVEKMLFYVAGNSHFAQVVYSAESSVLETDVLLWKARRRPPA
jgi:hypothetical protein